jgi:hypothetical protein
MMIPLKKLAVLAALGLGVAGSLWAAPPPKIAVTDLAYEERVQEYFKVVTASEKSSLRASGRESERETDYGYARRSSGSVNAKSESHYASVEGTYSYIDRGEFRKFTADVKGELLKAGGRYSLVQGRPLTNVKDTDKLYDVIARIKKGMYPGADYVLFGSINSIEFRQEANPIDNTDTVSHSLSLELVGEFSLISTKNYQIKAAFSAIGSGSDVKLLSSRGGRVVLNRGRVVLETSKSLGQDVARQVDEQFAGLVSSDGGDVDRPMRADEGNREVIIFK